MIKYNGIIAYVPWWENPLFKVCTGGLFHMMHNYSSYMCEIQHVYYEYAQILSMV